MAAATDWFPAKDLYPPATACAAWRVMAADGSFLETPWPPDVVEVARVLGAWGVAGGIKLKAYAADPQALFSTKRWYLQPPDLPKSPTSLTAPAASVLPSTPASAIDAGARFLSRPSRPLRSVVAPDRPGAAARVAPRMLRVVKAREQGDSIVATVQELCDRDAADALKGARVFVSRASFPTPAADEFYWVDLIGLAVVNRESVALGVVVGLLETGPHCVLRIQPPEPKAPECLIPFVSVYVDAVDKAAGLITVDWQAGD
jgi:16S rRNA processing protein RimM